MLEAYEIGISLALQDGVSTGIALVRRDLDALDRAIAATSQNLARLQAQAGAAGSGPASVQAPVPQVARQTVLPQQSQTERATIQKVADNPPPMAKAFTDAPMLPPPSVMARTNLQQPAITQSTPPIPVAVSTAVSTPQLSGANQPPANLAFSAPRPSPDPPPARPGTPRSLDRPPPTTARTPIPVALPTTGTIPGPPPAPAHPDRPATPVIAPLHAARPRHHATAQAGHSRPSDPDATSLSVTAPPTAVRPPAISARAQPRAAHAVTPAGAQPRAAYAFVPAAPISQRASTQTGTSPTAPATSAVPPAAAPPTITLQGDIILDGTRLGRWMTSSLARQAARPPSGPTGPDPRQTPLWSGQAQGF